MTTETMTIHRALAELKVLDDRIMKLLSEAKFCGAAKNCMQKLGGVTIEEYKQNAQSTYDKITDLMARQAAIKRAVSESNAVTHAVVCGHDYTVAQLIWMNQHGIDFKSTLLNVLERQYASAVAATEAANSKLSDKADDFISRNNAGADKNSMDAEAIKDVYNVEEVATLLKTTRPVVYSLIEKGYLPSIVLGRRKVTRKALLEFLDKNANTDFGELLRAG